MHTTRVSTNLHLATDAPTPTYRLIPDVIDVPYVSIDLGGQITVYAENAEWLRALSQQASLAAMHLDTALEVAAARATNAANVEADAVPFGTIPAPVRRIEVTSDADHYEVSGSVGGEDYSSECICGTFLSALTAELLAPMRVQHYWTETPATVEVAS